MIGGKELNPTSIRKHRMAKLFYIWNWNDQLVQWHHSEEQGENPFLVWSFKEGTICFNSLPLFLPTSPSSLLPNWHPNEFKRGHDTHDQICNGKGSASSTNFRGIKPITTWSCLWPFHYPYRIYVTPPTERGSVVLFFFLPPDYFCLNWYSVLPVRGLLSLEVLTEMQMFNHQMVWVGRDL